MATIEQLEALNEAWEDLNKACEESACCPSLKAEVVVLFRDMTNSFKSLMDIVESKYWKADGENMDHLTKDFHNLAEKIRQAIRYSENPT